MSSYQGGCQCGAVRFTVNAEPLMSGFCHCLDCQKSSGASRVMHVAFPAAALEVSGATAKFVSTADSGGTVTREFCPVCGSRLFGSSTTMPGMKTVHASVFDNPAGFAPMMSVYVKRMQPWDHAEPNLPAFEAMPPMP